MKHPSSDQLHHFYDAGYDLIPLHQAHARSKTSEQIGKRPVGRDWQKKPPLTLEEAKLHMAEGGNIGIRLKRHDLVIDVDPRNFGETDSFNDLVAMYPALEPFTEGLCRVAIKTGGRTDDGHPGYHFYFRLRLPQDWDERDRLRSGLKNYPGVEFKTLGTQVLAIGSVHPDTDLYYEWALADKKLPDMDAIPELPDELFRDLWKHPASQGPLMEGADWTPEMLAEFLAQLDPVDYREHDKWLNLMMACHSATLGDGISEFALWSISDPQYSQHYDQICYRWDTLNVDGDVTVKTLHYIAEQKKGISIPRRPDADFGDTLDEDRQTAVTQRDEGLVLPHMNKSGEKIKDTLPNALLLVDRVVKKEGWKVRYNTLHRQAEITGRSLPWDARLYRNVSQQLIDDRLWLFVNGYFPQYKFDRGISPNNIAFALNVIAQTDCYNPLTEYLGGLTWDGKKRIGKWFIDRFGAKDTPLNQEASTLFFRALVARAHQPGTKYDMLMVLEGKQGSGKSSGLKALCPNEDWFTDHPFELHGNGNPADAIMPFLGKWIHEFPEVSTLTPVTMNKAKAMISKPVDQFRKPYGRGFEDAPRGYVTVGTTNDTVYLSDMTGNRRFLPIGLDNRMIDIDAIAAERDQLFAEAQALYDKDPSQPLHLPSALWSMAADEADKRQADHPWVDFLEHYLEGRTRIAAVELYPQVGIKGTRGSIETKVLASVMRRLGWTRKKAIKIPSDEINEHTLIAYGMTEGKAYAGYVLDITD